MSDYSFKDGILKTPEGIAAVSSEIIFPQLMEGMISELEAAISRAEKATAETQKLRDNWSQDGQYLEVIVTDIYENSDLCHDCSHFNRGSGHGSGGPDPASCNVLSGEELLTECPGLPDPKTIRAVREEWIRADKRNIHLSAKLQTILNWCHSNIESKSLVAPFCTQVRDVIEGSAPYDEPRYRIPKVDLPRD